jgi:phosphoribosylformimino-5-aminoimidazole carboxamide ribotide isomerase
MLLKFVIVLEQNRLYEENGLTGGHVIMLGPGNKEATMDALRAYPGGLQVGGGINLENAREFLEAGVSNMCRSFFP